MNTNTISSPEWTTELLHYCSQNVPRYKGLTLNLLDYPIIDKQDLISNSGSQISDEASSLRNSLIEVLRGGKTSSETRLNEFQWNNLYIEETSGTSGIPLRIPKTKSERALAGLELWRKRKFIDPLVTRDKFVPFFHQTGEQKLSADPNDCALDNLLNLYRYLEDRNIRWIHISPVLLARHATSLRKPFRSETFRYIEISGSFLRDDILADIRSAFSMPLINQYGCREVWGIAYGNGQGVFSVQPNIIVEIAGKDGEIINDACVPGSVLVTSRFQHIFPFIRYNTHDVAKWIPGHIGHRFILVNQHRGELGVIGGKRMSGSEYFRIMMLRAFNEIGFIAFGFIQIRQNALNSFTVFTDDKENGIRLCVALTKVCRHETSTKDFIFYPECLGREEILSLRKQKPRLFIPKDPIGDFDNAP